MICMWIMNQFLLLADKVIKYSFAHSAFQQVGINIFWKPEGTIARTYCANNSLTEVWTCSKQVVVLVITGVASSRLVFTLQLRNQVIKESGADKKSKRQQCVSVIRSSADLHAVTWRPAQPKPAGRHLLFTGWRRPARYSELSLKFLFI